MRYDLLMIDVAMKQFVKLSPKNIFEIGSRDGHDMEYMRRLFNLPEQSCHIFEAHPDCYANIGNTYPNFNLFNYAITNKTRVVEFNAGIVGVEDNIGGSSILRDVTGNFRSNTVSVDGWRFDEACHKLGIEEVDLIKIDVEGFEMNVLRGAKDTLKNCNFLMIELNNNSKKYNSSNAEIEKYLQELGFSTLIDKWPDKVFIRNN